DALLSDTTVAMLAGQEAVTTPVKVVGREQFRKGEAIELDADAIAGSVYVYEYSDGLLGSVAVVENGDMEDLTADLTATGEVMVFFEYLTEVGKSNQITFSGN